MLPDVIRAGNQTRNDIKSRTDLTPAPEETEGRMDDRAERFPPSRPAERRKGWTV